MDFKKSPIQKVCLHQLHIVAIQSVCHQQWNQKFGHKMYQYTKIWTW